METRDTFARLMNEVCYDVEIEPKLQSLQGESFQEIIIRTDDDPRWDIKARGLWESQFSGRFLRCQNFQPPMHFHAQNPSKMPTPITKNFF